MSTTKGLSETLFPKTRLLIFRELVLTGDKGIHLRELSRRTGLDPSGIFRELQKIKKVGIVLEQRSGNQIIYSMNKNCPIYPEIHMLIVKTVGIADELRNTLKPFQNEIDIAFIYGSFATGEERSTSDIDLMIIGDIDEIALNRKLNSVEMRLNRPINYSLMNRKEFKKRRREKEGFLRRILTGKKIVIMDKNNEL